MFGNMTQLEHYRRKFADRGPQVVIEVGMSQQNLAKYPNKSFDLIYIDGDHSYAGVKQDTNLAKTKIADNGIIVFNDYIMYDYINGMTFGVVRSVNELIINEDWRVCGFALNWGMFCDIAVRKPCGPSL
jgi:predicted O-methyltransferase YrrM